MKTTKKLVSLLLAAAISAAGFSFSVSAQDIQSSDLYEAQMLYGSDVYEVQVLHDLGIFEQKLSSYKPEESVSRAEFAYLTARFMGHKERTVNYNLSVADVESGYIYASAIGYLLDSGIMTADSSNRFRPLEKITYNEAVRTLVCALGYKSRAELKGGGNVSYQKTAREIKLLSQTSDSNSEEITYAELVHLLYNALNIPLLEITAVKGDNMVYSNKTGETALSLWHDAEVLTGLLTHVDRGAATMEEGVSETGALIGGYSFNIGEVVCSQYIGYIVKAYYNRSSNTLLSVIPDVAKNKIQVVDAKDICGFKGGVLSYYTDRGMKTISVPASANVVYNGVAVAYDKRAEALAPKEGYLVINQMSYGNINRIFLVTEYKTYVVGAKTVDYTIYDSLSGSTVSMDPVSKSVRIMDEGGNDLSYDDIAEGDVLTIAADMSGTRIRAQRSNKKVTGTLTQCGEDNGEPYFVVDGVTYLFASAYINSGKKYPQAGSHITMSLDTANRIADVRMADKSDFSYGFLKEAAIQKGAFDSKLRVRIYDGSGVKTFDCTDRVCVDNYRTKNGEEAVVAIKRGMPTATVYQPIRFRLNEENQVTHIDTAYHNTEAGESADSLRYIYRGNNPYNLGKGESLRLEPQSGYNFGQKLITWSSSLRYTIPDSPDADDQYFRNNITMWPDGSFVVDGLTARENSLTADLVIQYKAAGSSVLETMYGMVKDVQCVLNDDEEETYRIFYVNTEGSDSSMCLAERDMINAPAINGEGNYTISQGDFISFGRSGKDEIVELQVIYDAEAQRWLNSSDSVGSFGNHLVTYGYVLQKDNGIIRVSAAMPTSQEEMLAATAKYINTAPTAIYRWDFNRKLCEKVSNSELLAYAQVGSACSQIVSGSYNGIDRIMVIYE